MTAPVTHPADSLINYAQPLIRLAIDKLTRAGVKEQDACVFVTDDRRMFQHVSKKSPVGVKPVTARELHDMANIVHPILAADLKRLPVKAGEHRVLVIVQGFAYLATFKNGKLEIN